MATDTEIYGPLPANYTEKVQLSNFLFKEYREVGAEANVTQRRERQARNEYLQVDVPAAQSPNLFGGVVDWERLGYPDALTGIKIDGPPLGPEVGYEWTALQKRYIAVNKWFQKPSFVPQRALGFGGQGLTIHYKYTGGPDPRPLDVVVKVARDSWQDDDLIEEEKNTQWARRSAHCIQSIDAAKLKIPYRPNYTNQLPSDDSSADDSGSGSDTGVVPRRAGRKRGWRAAQDAQYWDAKRQRKAIREAELDTIITAQGRHQKAYMFLEFLENGSLAALIRKLNAYEDEGEEIQIPNRVLWSFWLCMVRACVAMEYPPRKFHPLRKPPPPPPYGAVPEEAARANRMIRALKSLGIALYKKIKYDKSVHDANLVKEDLIEEIPITAAARRRRENMVHFDIDPQNVLVNGFEVDQGGVLAWTDGDDSASAAKKGAPGGAADGGQSAAADGAADGGQSAAPGGAAPSGAPGGAADGGQSAAPAGAAPGGTAPGGAAPGGAAPGGAAPGGAAPGGAPGGAADGTADGGQGAGDQGAKANATKASAGPSTKANKLNKRPVTVKKRPDRVEGEHEFIPRLKLADFGLAERIKPQKRNTYYLNRRWKAKHGMFAPEQFGGEWDKIPADPDGSQLADHAVAGTFSSATNIWGMALTMWSLITKLDAPTPPQPQVPDGLDVGQDPNKNLIDGLLEAMGYIGGISYCPLLKDPDFDDYDWVDDGLRTTIYKCMYHRPRDRPSLAALLDEAKRNAQEDFGESDEEIQRWIRRWFYDALPDPPGTGPHPGPGPDPGPPVPQANPAAAAYDAAGAAAAQDNPKHGLRLALEIRMNHRFPWGWDRIPNAAPNLQCGIFALRDSLQAQLGSDPATSAIPLPDEAALQAIMTAARNAGEFDHLVIENPDDVQDANNEGNYYMSQLARVLQVWGNSVGLNLALAYVVPDRTPMFEPVPAPNPTYVWIFNNNARADASKGVKFNHYEGIRAKPEPADDDGDMGLPDYESSSEEEEGQGGA